MVCNITTLSSMLRMLWMFSSPTLVRCEGWAHKANGMRTSSMAASESLFFVFMLYDFFYG